MKRLILALVVFVSVPFAQPFDAAGSYKLSGLDVQYHMIARYDTDIEVTNTDLGQLLTTTIATIGAGEFFYQTRSGPYSEAVLANILNVNLNLSLYEDGTGHILEGSFYPDVDLIEGTCVSAISVLAITDELIYTSDGGLGLTNYGMGIAGVPGITQYTGQTFGGLGLQQSVVFDYFPMVPEHPTLCDGSVPANCFNIVAPTGSLDGFYACVGDGGDPATCAFENGVIPAGAPMPYFQAGYFWKEGVNGPDDITSIIPGNTDPQFYLEWHAIDGIAAESGLGDIIGEDEDGDGTDFDRILGLPYITATYMSPACGFNYPIFGDASLAFEAQGLGMCVAQNDDGSYNVGVANDAYVMDPSGSLATWGNFLTANGALFGGTYAACEGAGGLWNMIYGGCLQQGGDAATCAAAAEAGAAPYTADGSNGCYNYCGANYGANDSDHDFNGVDGRLVMNFAPTCVPEIEMRQVIAEFIDITFCDPGDVNSDGTHNVLDVVALVQAILGGVDPNSCSDLNGDDAINVLDVVALVGIILGPRADNADSANINIFGNTVTMNADGYVGAVQMTLTHGEEFELTLTDNALVAEYVTEGSTTRLMVVAPNSDELFTANGDFVIESVIAATSEGYITTNVIEPAGFEISTAYPNPFNPTTTVELNMRADGFASVQVYNLMGQVIATLHEGNLSVDTYNFTWDAANVSSGVYFIKTEVGTEVHNQKVMLLK